MATTITTTTESAEQVAQTLNPDGKTVTKIEGEQPKATEQPKAEEPKKTAEDERIERMTWERYQLQHQLSQAAAQNTDLARRISELERGGGKSASSPTSTTPAAAPEIPAFAKPKPKIDDFGTIEEWTEALTDWAIEAADHRSSHRVPQQVAAVRQESQQDQVMADHQSRLTKFKSEHPDFDDVAQRALTAGLPVTPTMDAHFINTEVGPALMYHLATHPEECRKIAGLPPARQIAALGRLEGQLESAASQPGPPVGGDKSKTPTPPPAPITPSGSGSAASTKHPGEMSFTEYREWRRKGGK